MLLYNAPKKNIHSVTGHTWQLTCSPPLHDKLTLQVVATQPRMMIDYWSLCISKPSRIKWLPAPQIFTWNTQWSTHLYSNHIAT